MITISNSVFNHEREITIKSDNVSKALSAIHAWLDKKNEIVSKHLAGQAFTGAAGATAIPKYYSFEEQIYALGWDAEVSENGDITDIWIASDCLYGDEDEWMQAIAPFVVPGSFIGMENNCGQVWRWYFDGANCTEHMGKLEFPTMPKKTL